MKTNRLLTAAIALSVLFFSSCERESLKNETVAIASDNTVTDKKNDAQGVCNPDAYIVTLESRMLVDGNWEWIWSVQNPNPGNGNNGTAQDLSHWGMQLAPCVEWNAIVGASYSANGTTWTSFTPAYQADPSQGCLTTPVLKFDFGTQGSAKSYYRLVLNQEYAIDASLAYYKSGSRCCTFGFAGIGCGGPVEVVE